MALKGMVNSRIEGERECNPGMFYGTRNIDIVRRKRMLRIY